MLFMPDEWNWPGLPEFEQKISARFRYALELLPITLPPDHTVLPPRLPDNDRSLIDVYNNVKIDIRFYENPFDRYDLRVWRFTTKEVHLFWAPVDNAMIQETREYMTNLYLLLHNNECNHLKKAYYVDYKDFVTRDRCFITYEKCNLPLYHYLRNSENPNFGDASGQYITTSVAKAIKYLNERGISHENVCVKSVYFDSNGTVLLGDFDFVATHQKEHFNNGITYSIIEKPSHDCGHDMWGLFLIWLAIFRPAKYKEIDDIYYMVYQDVFTEIFRNCFERHIYYQKVFSLDDVTQDVYNQFFKNFLTVDEFLGDPFYVGLQDKAAFVNDLRKAKGLLPDFKLEDNENVSPPVVVSEHAISSCGKKGDAVYVNLVFPAVPRVYKFTYPYGDEVALYAKLRFICDLRSDVLLPSDIVAIRRALGEALRGIKDRNEEGVWHTATPVLETPIYVYATFDWASQYQD